MEPLDQQIDLRPPPGSAIQVESFPEGITIRIRPRGIWRGSNGLFLFAVVWLAMWLPFSIGLLDWAWQHARRPGHWVPGLTVLCVGLVPDILLFWAAWRLGSQSAVIAIAHERIMVVTRGVWGTKRYELRTSEIVSIRPGVSGEDSFRSELQFYGDTERLLGTVSSFEGIELGWLAATLAQLLRIRPAMDDGNH